MNENDPLPNEIKNLRIPRLPQQGINSFLHEALKGVQASARVTDLSVDITKRISAMTTAADLTRHLLRSVELTKSPIQRIIDESAETAAVFSKLYSLTDTVVKATASMLTSADIGREILRSIHPPKSSIQVIIDAAQQASLNRDLDRISEQTKVVSEILKMYSSPVFVGISQAILQAVAAPHVWQSTRITDFASRILQESHFRQAIIQRLASEPLLETQPPALAISTEQVLEAVERGIEESGVLQQRDNDEAAVAVLFSWWAKLPQDLRTLVINLIAALLCLLFEYYVLVKLQPTSQLPVNHRVRIVQKITNNIFVNVGVLPEERRRFRVVTKDGIPVFRSNRRDSGKIWTLTAGQVVTVKFKKRKWTQVEWKDADSQEMLTGWVFTRYLKKI